MHEIFFATKYYVYDILLRVRILHAAASRSSTLTTRFYSSIICSSLLFSVTKLVDRCVDLTTPLSHDPIQCSIDVRELIQRVAL